MTKRRHAPRPVFFDAMATGVATWTTLSVRVPQLILGTMPPAERRRMVSEKVDAAAQGSIAAARAVAAVVARRASRTAIPTVGDMVAILDAATRPARIRVKANATRLAKPSNAKRKSRS